MIRISDTATVSAHPGYVVPNPYIILPREATLTDLWISLARKLDTRPDYVTYSIIDSGIPALYIQFLEEDVYIGAECKLR